MECKTWKEIDVDGDRPLIMGEGIDFHIRDDLWDDATVRVHMDRYHRRRMFADRYCRTDDRVVFPSPRGRKRVEGEKRQEGKEKQIAEDFRDNEARDRFELDVGGGIAFVTYRKSSGAIMLCIPKCRRNSAEKASAQSCARGAGGGRAQGRKLTVECDSTRSFMAKHPEDNDLLAPGQETQDQCRDDKAGCFLCVSGR